MDRKKTFITGCLVLLLIPFLGYGQRNISNTGAESGYPAVAVNEDGVILVCWPEGGHEAGTLYYSVFKDGFWSTPKNTKLTRYEIWFPQLEVDASGMFHLAYSDGKSRLNREIYHATYDSETDLWSSGTMIWKSEENSAWQRISIDKERIYILWHHENAGKYLGHDIIYQSKMNNVDFWPTAYERVSWTADDNSTHPDFKVFNERIYAVYMEGVGDSGPWRVFFKEGARGSAWQNIPVEELAGTGYRPALTLDDDRNVYVVWATKAGTYLAREKINGIWRATQVISDKFSPQQFGDIDCRNNVVVATWAQSDALGQSAYFAKKNAGTGAWEKPVQIAQGASGLFPRVWIDGNGYAHFVWQDRGDIYYDKYSVPPPAPFLQVEPQSLGFTIEGQNPDPVTVLVRNIGEKVLNYEVSVDQDWMVVTPASGNLKQDEEDELMVTVDARTLDEGVHTGTIEITSKEALNSPLQMKVTLDVLAPPIYPPNNFVGEVLENKALFYREYIHRLTWESNPLNRDIEKYRIYEIDGVNTIFLEELSATTFEYTRRHTIPGKTYSYELWAVDNKGRAGNDPARVNLSGSSAFENKEKDTKTSSIKSNIIKQ
jgi:hypothetical protein